MKNLVEFIEEALKCPNWKKVQKSLSEDDKKFVSELTKGEDNSYLSSEDIEQRLWKGDLKDKVDELYNKCTELVKDIVPLNDIVNYYSLARSGKQNKIELIAQILWSIEHFS